MTWLIESDSLKKAPRAAKTGLAATFALAAAMALVPGAPALAQDAKPAIPAQPAATQPAAPAKPIVESTTDLSKRLAKINKDLNEGVPGVNIALMDRDFLAKNMALQQLPEAVLTEEQAGIIQTFSDGSMKSVSDLLVQMDPNAAARQKLLADFITARTGVPVEPWRMVGLTLSTDVTTAQGFSIPGGAGPSAGLEKDKQFCPVFGEFADLDAETFTRVNLGINHRGMLPNMEGRALVNVLPLDVLRKAVDYHESGHCWFHAQKGLAANSLDEAVKLQHASETYADITAALLLAHYDGVTNAADQLANVRLANAALSAPFLVRKENIKSIGYYGAFIHTTEEGLHAAQKEIDRVGARALREMSVNDIRLLAFKILEGLPERGFKDAFVVTAMQQAKFDTSFFDDLRERKPEYGPSIDYALQLKEEMNKALPKVVDLRDFDQSKSALEQVEFNFDQRPPTDAEIEAMIERAQIAHDQTVAALKTELINMAGGAGKANDESLGKAYDKRVDDLRHVLENGNKDEREAAMKFLSVSFEALSEAVIQVDGAKPVPPQREINLQMPQGHPRLRGFPEGIIIVPVPGGGVGGGGLIIGPAGPAPRF